MTRTVAATWDASLTGDLACWVTVLAPLGPLVTRISHVKAFPCVLAGEGLSMLAALTPPEAAWVAQAVEGPRLCPAGPLTSSEAWCCRCSRDSPSSWQALKFLLRVSISALMPWWYLMSSSTEDTSLEGRAGAGRPLWDKDTPGPSGSPALAGAPMPRSVLLVSGQA